MDLIGFSGLQSIFGGSTSLWKGRVRDGLPIKTDPGPHSGRPRIFDSEIVTAWLIDQALAEAGKTGALDRGQEQARLFAVQADRQTLALQRELGEMIPGAVVEKVWSGMTSAARARLLAVPSGYGPVLRSRRLFSLLGLATATRRAGAGTPTVPHPGSPVDRRKPPAGIGIDDQTAVSAGSPRSPTPAAITLISCVIT